MKIEWLSDRFDKAKVTRGFWWWKREAVVLMRIPGPYWVYESTLPEDIYRPPPVLGKLSILLDQKRAEAIVNSHWKRST